MPRSVVLDRFERLEVASVVPETVRTKVARKKPLTIQQVRQVERGDRAPLKTPSEVGSTTSKRTIKASKLSVIPPRDKFCTTIREVKAHDKRVDDMRRTHAAFVEEQRRAGVYVNPDVFEYFQEVERADRERRRAETERRRAEQRALEAMQHSSAGPPSRRGSHRRARSATPPHRRAAAQRGPLRLLDVQEDERRELRNAERARAGHTRDVALRSQFSSRLTQQHRPPLSRRSQGPSPPPPAPVAPRPRSVSPFAPSVLDELPPPPPSGFLTPRSASPYHQPPSPAGYAPPPPMSPARPPQQHPASYLSPVRDYPTPPHTARPYSGPGYGWPTPARHAPLLW